MRLDLQNGTTLYVKDKTQAEKKYDQCSSVSQQKAGADVPSLYVLID